MKKNRIIILTILIHILPIILSAQILDSLTTTVLDSCLNYLHLEHNELGFEKAWAKDDTFKLEIVDYLLDNPLELPGYVEETVKTAKDNNIGNLAEYITKQLDIEIDKRNKFNSQITFMGSDDEKCLCHWRLPGRKEGL